MLSIVDNSVRDDVFGYNRSPAGQFFFDWLNSGKGTLVAGGLVLKELDGAGTFKNGLPRRYDWDGPEEYQTTKWTSRLRN